VSTVFADTFYWIALTRPLDAAHERSKKFTDDIVTTQEVLTEYLNFFSSGPEHLRRNATKGVQAILHDPTVRIVTQSDGSFHAGLDLFRARPDKGYSLTDCNLKIKISANNGRPWLTWCKVTLCETRAGLFLGGSGPTGKAVSINSLVTAIIAEAIGSKPPGYVPHSRIDYWLPKLERNKQRDAENLKHLKALGWKVLTVWECQLSDQSNLQKRLQRFLGA
jgi:predicted nucleic acid-binding protein